MIKVYPGGRIRVSGEDHIVDAYFGPKRARSEGYVITDEGRVFWDRDFLVIESNAPLDTLRGENERRWRDITDGLGRGRGGEKMQQKSKQKTRSEMVHGVNGGRYVHSFLDQMEAIETEPTKTKGVRNYKITNTSLIFVNDYIVKWSDNGCNKVIYKVEHTTTAVGCSMGRMRDLVALGEVDATAEKAILAIDKDVVLEEEKTASYCQGYGER